MKRREMLQTTAAAVAAASFPWQWVAAADRRRQHVLMFTKSVTFEHSVVRRRQQQKLAHAERVVKQLADQHGFDVTITKDGGIFDSDLDRFDGFLFYTTGDLTKPAGDGSPPMSAAGKQRLLDAVAGGKGFVGSHCASDTFHTPGERYENQTEPDPYIAMLGGEFIVHGAQQISRQRVVSPTFPGVQKLGDGFEMLEEWYALKNFSHDLHVILVQETKGMKGPMYQRPPYPSTWARRHEKGRVFYTSMGHREDVWTNDIFHQVLLGGLSWTLGNVEADVTPNIDRVTPGAWVLKNS